PPLLGRTFGPEEDQRQGLRTVVISHSYWLERYAGDPGVLGRELEVDTFRGGNFQIIGVMPPGFDLPAGASIWLSLADWGGGARPARAAIQRCCSWYTTLARLKPGVSAERAAAELTSIGRRVSERHPGAARVTEVRVLPLRESMVGTHRLALTALFAAVGCV